MAVGDPTGDDLCVGTTNGNNLPEVPANDPEQREIDFGAGVELTEGVKYAIVVRAPDAGSWSDTGWSLKDGGGYATGVYRSSNNSGSTWSTGDNHDLWFQTLAGVYLRDNFTFAYAGTGSPFGNATWSTQTFTATSTYTITSVILHLYRQTGESPGTITVSIKATVGAPEQPKTPAPGNAATTVTLDQATLTWEDGVDNGNEATSYDVYYGDDADLVAAADNTDETGIYRGNQAETSFTITDVTLGSPFDYLIARYWRIDAVNDAGTTTGVAWSFVCIAFDPPLPTGITLDASGDPTGTPTGENNMITLRKLVVAAENKIWYENI